MASNIEIFLCYAHEDELLCNELVMHLGALKRQRFFDLWYDRKISAGTEFEQEIDKHLNTAQIILLLVSHYFMNSNYCYLIEMQRAIERHERGEARVIPILLRPVYFQRAPFAKLMPLPVNQKPITDSSWHSLDEAFYDVAEGIRNVAEELAIKLSVNSLGTQAALPVSVERRAKLVVSKSQHFRQGDKVLHKVFGEGVVVKSEIDHDGEFVDVQFLGGAGKKRLSVFMARLEKL